MKAKTQKVKGSKITRLNIRKLRTAQDLINTDWNKYKDKEYPNWIRYITDPISSQELNRICKLAERAIHWPYRLGWSMGNLYLSQKLLF